MSFLISVGRSLVGLGDDLGFLITSGVRGLEISLDGFLGAVVLAFDTNEMVYHRSRVSRCIGGSCCVRLGSGRSFSGCKGRV